MESTERNAGASAVINPRKEDDATARSSASAHCAGCKNSRLSGFRGIITSWSHLKIGSKAIAKRKPLAGQPCRTPLATRNCPLSAPANSTCVTLFFVNIFAGSCTQGNNIPFSRNLFLKSVFLSTSGPRIPVSSAQVIETKSTC